VHFAPSEWEQQVPELVAPNSIFQRVYSDALAHFKSDTPLILDPACPTNNMAASITQHGWELLLEAADPRNSLLKVLRTAVCLCFDHDVAVPYMYSAQLVVVHRIARMHCRSWRNRALRSQMKRGSGCTALRSSSLLRIMALIL
jgi:2'-5'-oligoadenylate synthetase 1, domain 2, C-terminus